MSDVSEALQRRSVGDTRGTADVIDRLSLATGDTVGAIRALRHFVALSDTPEPARRAEVDFIGGLLSRLGAAPR